MISNKNIMSEYTNVEHPFLEKLREIKWQGIDKGSGGILYKFTKTLSAASLF